MEYYKAIATPPGQPAKRVKMTEAEVAEFLGSQKAMREKAEKDASEKAAREAAIRTNLKGSLMVSDKQLDDLIKLVRGNV